MTATHLKGQAYALIDQLPETATSSRSSTIDNCFRTTCPDAYLPALCPAFPTQRFA
jgi:hypothetical protein